MRLSSCLLILFLFLASCQKNINADVIITPPPPVIIDAIVTPAPEPLTTTIVGLVTDETNQGLPATPVASLNFLGYPVGPNATFNTGVLTADRYINKLGINVSDPGHFDSYKTFPVSASTVNYVSVKPVKAISIGLITNNTGGTYNFQTGCSINFGINSLYETPYATFPGFYDPSLTGTVYASYLNPTAEDFAVRIPCYSMADENQKRFFLKSFAVVNLKINSTTPRNMDFHNNSTGLLKLPIPAALLATAPDSVQKWYFKDGGWIKNGYAKKVNNNYEASINTIAAWNFALPVKGVYKTLHLRTDSGAAVVNATIRIKANNIVVQEMQTDADGNAYAFVPANETLTLNVLNRWGITPSGTVLYTTSVPASNTAANFDVVMPSNLPLLYTFRGNASNCSGSGIQNGMLTIRNQNIMVGDYYVAIQNGKFNSAIFFEGNGSPNITLIKAKNITTNEVGTDTAILVHTGIQDFNVNTCPLASNLFMNFTANVTSYSIIGDISHPYTPALNASLNAGYTSVTTDNNAGQGLQFNTNATTIGTYTGSGINSLFINGSYFNWDFNKPMTVIFSRYDPVVNGFIAGSADFYYYDAGNVSRHLTATFKLRRSF